ncbi:MAG: tetratricopeptide repeat protein [Anaerolineales bacterium]|nr:tetratricopeptide repeat protein [Anaerolineales bacterium]
MPKTSPEQVIDFLLGFLPSLLPKPVDSAAKSAIDSFRGPLDEVLKEPRIHRELLEAAQKAESEFRSQGHTHLKNDDLVQAVASFPLFDRTLFQSTLANLPNHLREEYLAKDLQSFIEDDWKGKFPPKELREGIALYLNCLRIELLKVEGFADIVIRLATLRTDQRVEQILEIVKELVKLVSQLMISRQTNVLDSHINLLPADISFFSGRKTEIKELEDILLKRNSIVSIYSVWGMGGIGKSALAIRVATKLHEAGHFQDGVLWVDMRASSVDETLSNFIRAFGYTEDQIPKSQTDKASYLRSIFRGKQVLVLLDNVSSEEEVTPFIVDEPTVAFVITSRRQLLGMTDYSAYIKDLDIFSLEDSLELMQKRLGSRCQDELNVAKEICRLAGNLPLAVSVAAARLSDKKRWSTLQMFVDRLQDAHNRLDEYKGNTKEKNLRAVFSVSYDSLEDAQKQYFAYLSLFDNVNFGSSGFMALFETNKQQAIGHLENLVELSLLLRSELGGYRFHDLLLLFSQEKLRNEYPETKIVSAKAKVENYQQLLTTARKLGARASSSVHQGKLDQGIELYSQSQIINQQIYSRSGQASALGGLASAYAQKGDLDKAIELYSQSIILSKEIGNRAGQASALGGLASAHAQKGDLDKAIEYYQQAQLLNKEIGNRAGQASALGGLASAYAQKGDLDKAIKYYQQAQLLNKEIGNRAGQASALGGLASAHAQKGDLDKAIELYSQSIILSKEIGNRAGQASALGGLASAHAQKGDLDKAIELHSQSIILSKEIGNRADKRVLWAGWRRRMRRRAISTKPLSYIRNPSF